MKPSDFADLVRGEQRKRAAHRDPAEHWRQLQAFLAWAEAQTQPRRNSKECCLALQRAKLAAWDRGAAE